MPRIDAQLQAQGVTMLGFVEDIDKFFDAAAVTVGPYRFGGGVKIQVLEAMARACPVVATAVGAEGLGVVSSSSASSPSCKTPSALRCWQ